MHWGFIITLIAAVRGECFILIPLAGGENSLIFIPLIPLKVLVLNAGRHLIHFSAFSLVMLICKESEHKFPECICP